MTTPRLRPIQSLPLLALAASLIAGASAGFAATKTWNAGVNTTWDTATTANWTGSTWANGDDAVFGATGVGTVNITGSGVAARTITFNTAGYTLTGGTITVPSVGIGGTPAIVANQDAVINLNVNLPTAATWSVASGKTLTFGGVLNATNANTNFGISGAGSYIFNGSIGSNIGSVLFNSSASSTATFTTANAFTGQLFLGQGGGASTLNFSHVNQLGSGTGGSYIAIQNGSTFRYTGATNQAITGRDFFYNVGAATIDIQNAAGSLSITPTGGTRTQAFTKTGAGTLTLNGAQTGGSITVDGGTLNLTATNTYTGATTVNAGKLTIGDGGTVGAIASTSAVSVANGATIEWNNANTTSIRTVANNLSGAGKLLLTGQNSASALHTSLYDLTGNNSGLTGTIELNRAMLWNTTNANEVGAASIVVGDRATFATNAALTLSNNFTINAGAGWHHNVSGGDYVIGALRLESSPTLTGGIVLNSTTSIVNGDLTSANSVIGAYSASNATLSGVISGAGDLAMSRFTSWNGGSVQTVNIDLTGASSNTFTGKTVVDGQGSAASLRLGKTGGAVAIQGGTVVQMGSATTGQANLRMLQANQFGTNNGGVTMNFVNASGNWMRFDLQGTTQTLAGLNGGTTSTIAGAVVQNGGISQSISAGGTLTLMGSGTYLYNGYLRNADTGGGAGTLALIKSGTGKQTLVGGNIIYSGPTTIQNGTLQLYDATGANSAMTIQSAGTLELTRSVNGFASRSTRGYSVTGAGTLVANAATNGIAGGWALLNGTVGLTGQINVLSGVFGTDNTSANWSANTADVNVSSGAIFTNRGNSITIGGLNGAGDVAPLWNGQTTQVLTLGAANKSGNFSGSLRGSNVGADATLEAGVLNLTKIGTGTQILSGDHTYTGATIVNGGTLLFHGTKAGGGAVTVNNTATLGGHGVISGNTTINSGGTLSPGASPGTITFADNLTINPGAIYHYEGSDLTVVLGTLALGNDTLSNWVLQLGDKLKDGGYSVLFEYGALAANFDLTPTFDLSQLGFTPSGPLSVVNDVANQRILLMGVQSGVPEPSTCVLLGVGITLGAWQIRRKRRATARTSKGLAP